MDLTNFLPEDTNAQGENTGAVDAWKTIRLSKFTSSQIDKLNTTSKTEGEYFGQAAITYIYDKAAEAITLEDNEGTSAAIKWGEEHEPDAAIRFERFTGKTIEYYGKKNPLFIQHHEHPDDAGGSPDFFVPEEEAVGEIKCPYESKYHVEVLRLVKIGKFDLRKYDKEYYGQLQFNICLTNSKYGYFVSYDPRCIDFRLSLVVVRIERDEKYITKLNERLKEAVKLKHKFLQDAGYYEDEVARDAA